MATTLPNNALDCIATVAKERLGWKGSGLDLFALVSKDPNAEGDWLNDRDRFIARVNHGVEGLGDREVQMWRGADGLLRLVDFEGPHPSDSELAVERFARQVKGPMCRHCLIDETDSPRELQRRGTEPHFFHPSCRFPGIQWLTLASQSTCEQINTEAVKA